MQDGTRPKKEIVNLAVDAALVERARERGVDLAELLERALQRELPAREARGRIGSPAMQKWRLENADTIKAWNQEVEREGLWNDEIRPF